MSALPVILVTGANGQLGNSLRKLELAYPDYQFLFATRQTLAIESAQQVANFFDQHSIAFCINCAAYTAVDKAEQEVATVNAINGNGPGYLATACKKVGAGFIHISTDYVFDGLATAPYQTDHPVNPVNAYGASKLLGEQLVRHENPDAVIIRTSWVYAVEGNNFVKTMMRLMKERPSLNVVSDQIGSPTYAPDLAAAIMKIVQQQIQHPASRHQQGGVYHYSNTGIISWYQFAVAIRDLIGSSCDVLPIPSTQYPTPAKRPNYSVMDIQKIQQVFAVTAIPWNISLKSCIEALSSS